MLMFRKYSPQFATPSEIEAQRYAARLVWPAAFVGFLLRFPMPQWGAALMPDDERAKNERNPREAAIVLAGRPF